MVTEVAPDLVVAVAGRSQWQDAWIRLRRNRAAVASAIVLLLLALAGIVGPLVWPHPHDRVYPAFVRAPASLEPYPRAETVLPDFERELARTRLDHGRPTLDGGTISVTLTSDEPIDPRILRYFQRSDQLTNPQLTLSEDQRSAELTAEVALVLGVTYGAVAGYLGGRVDNVMMRVVDILYSLPFIFFMILMVVFFGRSIVIIFIAIGATEWLDMACIVRGQTLSLKRQEFVRAAEALGATRIGILTRHIIPNTLGPVVVFVTLLVPKAILLESLLSFLGLGVQEPLTSLGLLISEGASNTRGALWLLLWPAVTLTLILFALNFLGDGLRDSLDPKDR